MSNVAPGFQPIQQESIQFNQPASEAAMTAIGGAINGLLSILMPVGSMVMAALTETQFQNAIGNPNPATWVLADGRNVTGSQFQVTTGNTNIPDMRGTYARGADNGRGLDPNGNQTPGTFITDQIKAHSHSLPLNGELGGVAGGPSGGFDTVGNNNQNFGITSTQNTGGPETAPKTTYVNFFIRIN